MFFTRKPTQEAIEAVEQSGGKVEENSVSFPEGTKTEQYQQGFYRHHLPTGITLYHSSRRDPMAPEYSALHRRRDWED
jgi:hypothetical protein